MNFEQLEQLAAIAQEGTVSGAAERLNISQPALSRSVRRLEGELGCALFDRTSNSMALNQAGKIVLEFAEETLRGRRNLTDRLSTLQQRSHVVRIGTVAPAPLWRLSAQILERKPGVLLSPKIMTEDAVERALMNRDVDYGITQKPVALPCCTCEPLMDEDLFAYLPRGHELARQDTVTFAELDGREFIVLNDIGVWWPVVERAMPRATFVHQADRSVMEQLLVSSPALAFVTNESASFRSFPDRIAVPITDPEAHMSFCLVKPA